MEARNVVKLQDALKLRPLDKGKIDLLLSQCAGPQFIERLRDVEFREMAYEFACQVVNYVTLAATADVGVDIDPKGLREEMSRDADFPHLAHAIIELLADNEGLVGILKSENRSEPDMAVFRHRLKLLTG